MYEIEINDMDLAQLAVSGQCFRMRRQEMGWEAECQDLECGAQMQNRIDCWSVTASNHYVEILQQGNHFTFSCGKEEFEQIWYPYFDMDTDYCAIKHSVDENDAHLQEAIRCGCGVRILRQDLWEMIVTFLISQNNNITRITGSVEALCQKFGAEKSGTGFEVDLEGGVREVFRPYYAFPDPKILAAAGLEGLSGLGLGYRDRYIAAIAKWCGTESGKLWLETLGTADYETALAMLMEQLGIGKKVAECVCLFGLHHVGAFPVDTHVKQIVKAYYPEGFPLERYSGYAGILQQYLFYYKINGRQVKPQTN